MSSKTPDPPSSTVDERGVFARSSTGLVREASARDAFMNNMSASAAPLALVLLFALGPAYYVGGNMFVAVFAALLLTIPIGLVYAMFATAIPRSGGDYTWISRSLSPTVGFASNFSYMFWGMFIIAIYGVLGRDLGSRAAPALHLRRVRRAARARPRGLADRQVGHVHRRRRAHGAERAAADVHPRPARVPARPGLGVLLLGALPRGRARALVFLVKSKSGFQGDFDAYARHLGATGSASDAINEGGRVVSGLQLEAVAPAGHAAVLCVRLRLAILVLGRRDQARRAHPLPRHARDAARLPRGLPGPDRHRHAQHRRRLPARRRARRSDELRLRLCALLPRDGRDRRRQQHPRSADPGLVHPLPVHRRADHADLRQPESLRVVVRPAVPGVAVRRQQANADSAQRTRGADGRRYPDGRGGRLQPEPGGPGGPDGADTDIRHVSAWRRCSSRTGRPMSSRPRRSTGVSAACRS